MMSADGLQGVMDQFAAFQGASTSMQADYKRFAATDALAQVFESKARRAKAEQVRLAARGRAGQAAGGRERRTPPRPRRPGSPPRRSG